MENLVVQRTANTKQKQDQGSGDAERVVTKAVLKAAGFLKLSNKELAVIIGVSERTLARIKNDDAVLKKGDTSHKLALYLIRIFRSLGALYGSNVEDMAKWVRSENKHLRTSPVEAMQEIAGLVHTMDYLDASRAKV